MVLEERKYYTVSLTFSAPNNRASKYIKKMTDIIGEIDNIN